MSKKRKKKQSYSNPDFLFTPEYKEERLAFCAAQMKAYFLECLGDYHLSQYRSRKEITKSKNICRNDPKLAAYYRECRLKNWLFCSLEEFLERVMVTYARPWPYVYYRGYREHTTKYVRNKDHMKKEVEFDVWREVKGINRDNRKAHYGPIKRKTFYVRYSHRLHRRWVKRCLHREQWDVMGDTDWKFFYDPWMWD